MENDLHSFIESDCREHKERSGAELMEHADPASFKTEQERKEYFYGITAVFPMMLLGHYYDWLTDRQGKPYMDDFVPANEKKCGAPVRALMEELYREQVGDVPRLATLCGGLAAAVYRTLGEFSVWAFSDEQIARAQNFIAEDMANTLPKLCARLAGADQKELLETTMWMGTEFPFEVLERFHVELFSV